MASLSLPQIEALIGGLVTVIGSVSGQHNGTNTTQVVGTIQQVVGTIDAFSGLKSPTDLPTAIADLSAILATVKKDFPNAGGAVDSVATEAARFSSFVSNAVGGQIVVVDSKLVIPGIPNVVFKAFIVREDSTIDSAVQLRTSLGL